MKVFVGLDCGGSSSRVLAVDAAGTVLFQGQSGAANLASTPEPRIKRNLAAATEGCPSCQSVCGCFAGLVNDDLRRSGEELLRNLFPKALVRAEPDYAAAFCSAPAGTDVCVIAGTGSLVCSRSDDGKMVKSGGRGYILGDQGSGFQYGREAVIEFLNDPSSVTGTLKGAILETFGTLEEGGIIAQVYKSGNAQSLLGRISKAVALDAKSSEPYALECVKRNTAALAEVVRMHIERHLANRTHVVVSLVGGMWKTAPVIREQFDEHLRALLPGRRIEVLRATKPPLYGAVELAKEMNIGN